MNLKGVLAVLSVFVSVSALATDATFGQEITTTFGKNGVVALGIIGVLGAVSAKVITALANYGTNTKTEIAATIVPPGTPTK